MGKAGRVPRAVQGDQGQPCAPSGVCERWDCGVLSEAVRTGWRKELSKRPEAGPPAVAGCTGRSAGPPPPAGDGS